MSLANLIGIIYDSRWVYYDYKCNERLDLHALESLEIDRKARHLAIHYPPVRWVYFSGEAMTVGIEKHNLDGVSVKVFSPTKTVADCFKYRNKIGLDVALEASREGWAKSRYERSDG